MWQVGNRVYMGMAGSRGMELGMWNDEVRVTKLDIRLRRLTPCAMPSIMQRCGFDDANRL